VTRVRWIVSMLVLLLLVGLVVWQRQREAQMEACLAEGRVWNGPQSRCESPRIGPILRRALERT
jgi:hypothetical protein